MPGEGKSGVAIVIGEDTAMTGVRVQKDGKFLLRVPVRRGPGILEVAAVQRSDKSVLRDKASVTVIESGDHEQVVPKPSGETSHPPDIF